MKSICASVIMDSHQWEVGQGVEDGDAVVVLRRVGRVPDTGVFNETFT